MNTKFVTLFSLKGGVGKTSTVLNLAFALKELGKKVLVVDFDPGASLSLWLRHDVSKQEDSTVLSYLMQVYLMLVNDGATEDDLKELKEYAEGSILNSSLGMDYISNGKTFEVQLKILSQATEKTRGWENHLKSLIHHVAKEYDYVLFDTHPVDDFSSKLPLSLSDAVVVVSVLDGFFIRSYEDTICIIERMNKEGTSIKFLGGVINKYRKNSSTTREMHEAIKVLEKYGEVKIFKDMIPETEKVYAGPHTGNSVFSNKRKEGLAVREAYLSIANEVILKMEGTTI